MPRAFDSDQFISGRSEVSCGTVFERQFSTDYEHLALQCKQLNALCQNILGVSFFNPHLEPPSTVNRVGFGIIEVTPFCSTTSSSLILEGDHNPCLSPGWSLVSLFSRCFFSVLQRSS